MGKIIRSSFLLANIVLVFFILFSYISPYINPSKTYFFSFFGLAYPFLLILNIIFVLFWLFSKSKKGYALISILAILLGYNNASSFINLSSVSKNQTYTALVSFNLQKLKSIRNSNGTFNEVLKSEFLNFLEGENKYKLLCTQETSSAGYNLIKKEYNYAYDHRALKQGIAIFSTYPIINKGEIDLKSDHASSAIWTDIEINHKLVRVYNLHLRSNKISQSAEDMLEDADLQSSKTWNSIRGILANYKNSTIHRSSQARLIKEHVSKSPYPVIICGDFNDTPLSYVYKILATDKKDSFKESGSGIGTTYAGVIPALRIDYILADERLDVVDHRILKENYSDHYPISAKIVLP